MVQLRWATPSSSTKAATSAAARRHRRSASGKSGAKRAIGGWRLPSLSTGSPSELPVKINTAA